LKCELVLSRSIPNQKAFTTVAIGGVAGILGAGNYDAPLAILMEMFLKGHVCIYKPNSVAQALAPTTKKLFEPLVSAGYLAYIIGSRAKR
jgi:hypothetical protein